MPFNTYSPDLVYDPASRRGVGGVVAKVTNLITGLPITTYDENGTPRPVITNPQGYISTFWTDDTISQIMVSAGGVSLPMLAQELVGAGVDAALAAQVAAEAAQLAAEAAASLVGTPADASIAAAVGGSSTLTRAALDGLFMRRAMIDGAAHGIVPGASSLSTKLAALSAANPGHPIFLGDGLFTFADPVLLTSGIVGIGAQTVLRFAELGEAALRTSGDSNVQFRNFTLESTSANTAITQASSHGIIIHDSLNFAVDNVYMSGQFVMGIQISKCSRGTVSNNTVTGTTYDGIHCTLGSTDITIVGNHTINTGDDAIALITYNTDPAPNKRITVTGNTINGVGHARGITVEGCVDAVVSANVIEDTFLHGILISSISPSLSDVHPTKNCVVTGNIIRGSGSDAIAVAGLNEGVVIRGNTITDTAFNGIYVINGNVVIADNVIDRPATRGIMVLVGSTNDGTVITGNVIRKPGTLGIYNEASDVTINHNVIVEPATLTTAAEGILSAAGDRITIIGNRVTGISPAKTGNAIWLDGAAGALVMGNYGTNVGNTFGNVNSTDILTA